MSTLKKLAGQTAVYGLSSIVGRFLNYLLVPLYTRVFLPHEYGVVTELYTYTAFLLILLTYGLETAFFRFAQNESDKRDVFPTTMVSISITSTLFVLLCVVLQHPIANALDYGRYPEYIVWFALIVSLDAVSAIPFAKLRLQNKAIRFAVIKMLGIAINILLNVLLLIALPWMHRKGIAPSLTGWMMRSDGVSYVFIANLVSSIATMLLLLPDVFNEHFHFNRALLKRILAYSLPLLVSGLAGTTNNVIDRVLLKIFTVVPQGVANANEYVLEQIGVYGANIKLAVIITLFIQAFRFAFEPFFFAQSKEKNSTQIYVTVMNYFVIFCLAMFVGIMCYIDITKFFIGRDYFSGLRVVPVVLLANILLGMVFNMSVWYKLTNKTHYGAYITILGAASTVLINIMLIPVIGYMGSAVAMLVSNAAMVAWSHYLGQKYYPIPYNFRKLGAYTAFALAIYGLTAINPLQSFALRMVLHSVLFFAFIGVAVWKEGVWKLVRR